MATADRLAALPGTQTLFNQIATGDPTAALTVIARLHNVDIRDEVCLVCQPYVKYIPIFSNHFMKELEFNSPSKCYV